jgi:hypothetical protein
MKGCCQSGSDRAAGVGSQDDTRGLVETRLALAAIGYAAAYAPISVAGAALRSISPTATARALLVGFAELLRRPWLATLWVGLGIIDQPQIER